MNPTTHRPRRSPSSNDAACLARRLFVFLLIAAALVAVPTAVPCSGTRTLTPRCAKTVVVNRVGPGEPVLLAPAGGAMTYDVTVFAAGSTFLPGPACPQPVSADILVEYFCDPGPDATGSIAGVALSPGFNNIAVPITVPPGPARKCAVKVTADVTFADGSLVTAVRHDIEICIVEESPFVPGEPRLDLELLTPNVQPLHAGDVGTYTYRLTNNDPANNVTVDLVADSRNSAVKPDDKSGNGDVYAISDPVGDAFPIYFDDDIPPNVCPPFPPRHELQFEREINREIFLLPGQVLDVDILVRPYGGCATGSCNEMGVSLEGTFSNGDPALACASSAVVVDNNQSPSFSCPGVGSTGQASVVNPTLKIADFQILINPFLPFGSTIPIRFQTIPSGFAGLSLVNSMLLEDTQESVRGVTRATPSGGGNFVPGTVITGQYAVNFSDPSALNTVSTVRMFSRDGVPNGSAHLAPVVFFNLQTTLLGPLSSPPSTIEPKIQYGVQGFHSGGIPGPVIPITATPRPALNRIDLEIVIPDSGPPIEEIEIRCDIRTYGFENNPNPPLAFQGTLVSPLGSAQLQVDPANDVLVVSNIGSSGLDGVSIDLGELPEHLNGGVPLLIEPYDLTLLAASLKLEAFGRLTPGGPAQPFGFAQLFNSVVGSEFAIFNDYSPLGATTTSVQVLRNGIIVGTATLPSGLLGTCTQAHPNVPLPRVQACGKLAPIPGSFPLPCYFYAFDELGQFNFPGYGPMVGDILVLLAGDPALSIHSITTLNLCYGAIPGLFTGIGGVGNGFDLNTLLVDELGTTTTEALRLEELEKRGVADLGTVFDGHTCRPLGQAQLSSSGDNLVVSNIGSSGLDGVSIDLGESQVEFEWIPLDLSNPGTAVDITGRGTVATGRVQSLGNLAWRNNNGVLEVDADYSALGTITVQVEIFDTGLPVGTVVLPAGQLGTIEPVPGAGFPLLTGCGKFPPTGPPCFFIRTDRPFIFAPTGGSGPLQGDEFRALATGLPFPIEILDLFEIRATNIGVLGLTSLSNPDPPVVLGVSPLTGEPGDLITVTGTGFDPDPDNNCAVLHLPGSGIAIPLEILTASTDSFVMLMGEVPGANAGLAHQVMVGTGRGEHGFFEPVLPDIIVQEPVWVWDFIGADNAGQVPPIPTFTPLGGPVVPGKTCFYADQPSGGQICVDLEDPLAPGTPHNWPNPAKVKINARLRDHTTGKGHDHFASNITLTNNTSPAECAAKICDVIRCSWAQQFGILVDCTVNILPGGIPQICLTFPNGNVDWGTLTICVEGHSIPIITAVDPPTGTTGDIITITGSGFDPDPDNNCVIVMQGGGSAESIPLDVLAARDDKIIARLGPVPPGAVNGEIMVARGEGRRGLYEPAFPEIVVAEPVWVWDFNGVETVAGNPAAAFTPMHTPPDPGTQYFHADVFAGGQICVTIPQAAVGTWDPNCKVVINARIRDHGTGKGHDSLHSCVLFNGPGPPLTYAGCMERICDAITCAWSQLAGVPVTCTFDPVLERICVGFANPACTVDWGNLTICIDCPDPAPPTPVITSVSHTDATTNDIVTILGTGFDPDPDNMCVIAMSPGGMCSLPLQVIDVKPLPSPPGAQDMTGLLQPVPPSFAGPGQIALTLGEGNRDTFIPLFPELTVLKPVWAWVNDPRNPDVPGPNLDPVVAPPGQGETWFFNDPPANGVMCIYIDGNWGANSKINVSGRMRDHTTGKGYDQFSSDVMITGPMTALECAERICDTITCAWSQLAGVRVICVPSPVGHDKAKITLAFENGFIDWGNITVCVTDLASVLTFDDWKSLNGVVGDFEDLDLDGIPAILEAYCGLDPFVKDNPALDQFGIPLGPNAAFSFDRNPGVIGLRSLVELTTDLVDFTPVAINPIGNPVTGHVDLFYPLAGLSGSDRVYWRFRVSRW